MISDNFNVVTQDIKINVFIYVLKNLIIKKSEIFTVQHFTLTKHRAADSS